MDDKLPALEVLTEVNPQSQIEAAGLNGELSIKTVVTQAGPQSQVEVIVSKGGLSIKTSVREVNLQSQIKVAPMENIPPIQAVATASKSDKKRNRRIFGIVAVVITILAAVVFLQLIGGGIAQEILNYKNASVTPSVFINLALFLGSSVTLLGLGFAIVRGVPEKYPAAAKSALPSTFAASLLGTAGIIITLIGIILGIAVASFTNVQAEISLIANIIGTGLIFTFISVIWLLLMILLMFIVFMLDQRD